jgi:citrate synthase
MWGAVVASSEARLSAVETAARLGVKPATLYAYVSRGLLSRERGPDGSRFDPIEVERFAAGRRRSGPLRTPLLIKEGRPSGGPLMTIDTDVALIEDDELYFRGLPAAELARRYSFEQVCRWIWSDPGADRPSAEPVRFVPLPAAVPAVRAVSAAMPADALITDRMRAAVPAVAAADPIRDVTDQQAVAHRAGAMIAALTGGLAPEGPDRSGTVADSVIRMLLPAGTDDHEALLPVVNAALVLLIDHDLAVSTLAARAAASARANPYAVVISGLGALDSPLHGNASRSVHRMLSEVLQGRSARSVITETLSERRGALPGFGHRIYRAADPRAEVLLELLASWPDAADTLAAADRLTELVTVHDVTFGNVDLALGALSCSAGMPAEAGEVIFALARIGGWIAHAQDEYSQPGLRLRPVGRYVGR